MRFAILLGCALVCAIGGCAGGLDDPDRFSSLLDGGTPGEHDADVGAPDAQPPDGQPDAGDGEPPVDASVVPEAPPACVMSMFETSCGGLPCHGAGAALLDLLSPGVTDRLVNEPASTGPCEGRLYVDPGGSSLLLDKVAEMPSCGERMPYAMPALEADEVRCLTDWVTELESEAP